MTDARFEEDPAITNSTSSREALIAALAERVRIAGGLPPSTYESAAKPAVAHLSGTTAQLLHLASRTELPDSPYYENGGGIKTATEYLQSHVLAEFLPEPDRIEAWQVELTDILDRLNILEITPARIAASRKADRRTIALHVIDYVDFMAHRGTVLATPGNHNNPEFQAMYGFNDNDENKAVAYGNQLRLLAAGISNYWPGYLELQKIVSGDPHTAAERHKKVVRYEKQHGKISVEVNEKGTARERLGVAPHIPHVGVA